MFALLLAAVLTTVKGDVSADGTPAATPVVVSEEIVIDESPCAQTVSSIWDWPLCDDYYLDTTLETAAKRRDHSAIDLLEQRYETTFTLREKQRIAAMLLNRVPDDSKYWKALTGLAEDSLRFAGDDDATKGKLRAFAAEKGIDPDTYLDATIDALGRISSDVRARDLIRRALDSNVPDLQLLAIWGFAAQHDESVLDRIDSVIEKASKDQYAMAEALAEYQSDKADKIAFKYLTESQRAEYLDTKQQLHDRAQQDR